jgi:Uma2 family endonuclease
MQAIDVLAHARPWRMSRVEYERVAEQGVFKDARVELIRGLVVEMPPIGTEHADKVDVLNRAFVRGVGDRAVIRVGLPVAASDDSEPEPDLALVPPRRYRDQHPDRAFLVVEVSESSLAHDRETKAPLYAESGVPEYWIVNVKARAVEVFDEPADGRYRRVRRFDSGSIAPAAFPDVTIDVTELFA